VGECRRNKEESKELVLRGYVDLKSYFTKKLCNSYMKITSSSAGPNDVTKEAQKIYRSILDKERSGNYGAKARKSNW
jgi:hypothetical protein